MTTVESPLPKLLLTVSEVAEMTAYSESFLYELIGKGVLPSIRLNRSIRVPSDQLTQWIKEQTGRGAES